jgi:hypothetical protein
LKGDKEAIANAPKTEFRAFVFNLLDELFETGILMQVSPLQMPNEYTLVNM